MARPRLNLYKPWIPHLRLHSSSSSLDWNLALETREKEEEEEDEKRRIVEDNANALNTNLDGPRVFISGERWQVGRRRASIDWCPAPLPPPPPPRTPHTHIDPPPLPFFQPPSPTHPPFSSRCFFLFLFTFRGLGRKNLIFFFPPLNFSTPRKVSPRDGIVTSIVSYLFLILPFSRSLLL